MNDTRNDNGVSRSLAPLIGFALGAVVGGGLALLMAPATGEHTRRRLGNAARRMSRDARHTLDGAREAASGFGADVKSALDAGREAFHHGGTPDDAPPVARIAQILTPPPARDTR